MRVHRLRKKWVAVFVGVAVIGTFAAVALGSGSFLFTSTPLVTANLDNKVQVNSDRIKLQTKDPTVVRVSTVVFGAGGYSGWHHHPGFVIVVCEVGFGDRLGVRLQPEDVRDGLRFRRERR